MPTNNLKQKTACYLENTDSDEEHISKSILERSSCDRSSPTFLPSYEETFYFLNNFHQMPHLPILDSTYQCGLVDIFSKGFNDIYNLHAMKLSEDYIYEDFSNDAIPTFEDLFWKEI